jgi:ferredoxin-NADP reductase
MLPLIVTRIQNESAHIVSLELSDPTGAPLPPWEPGAHVDMELITRQQRQYSLTGDPTDLRSYRIGVLREELSRGASMYVHTYLREGSTVYVRPPRNLFPVEPAEQYLLLAAGIGITPILPMAQHLSHRGARWAMHYAVRGDIHLPFRTEIANLGAPVTIHSPDHEDRLDLDALLATVRPGVAVYACGPTRFIDSVESAMRHWPAGALRLERFEPKPIEHLPNTTFAVRGARSGVVVEVPPEKTMLQALTEVDVPVTGSCLRGVCGSCAVRVVSGVVEHRDSLTSGDEATIIYPCVSRAISPELVVDL